MTTREIIKELEKQKSMLGTQFFDPNLLDKYLTLSTKDYQETVNIDIHGIGSLENINKKLTRLYPYETANQKFLRAHADWSTIFMITHKKDIPVKIKINRECIEEPIKKTPVFSLKYESKAA